MNDIKFYPSNKAEALAYLYVEKQDIEGKTPEELVDLYNEVYDRIIRKLNAVPARTKPGF